MRPETDLACTCKCKPGPFRAACRYLLFSAWLVLNHRGNWHLPACTFDQPVCDAVSPNDGWQCPQNPELHKKAPHPKRRRFTTSPHPGRDRRALPRPITRPGSHQALRLRERHPLRRPVIQGRGGVKRSTSTTSPLTLHPLAPSSAWIVRPVRELTKLHH